MLKTETKRKLIDLAFSVGLDFHFLLLSLLIEFL